MCLLAKGGLGHAFHKPGSETRVDTQQWVFRRRNMVLNRRLLTCSCEGTARQGRHGEEYHDLESEIDSMLSMIVH